MPMQQDQYWRDASIPESAERAARTQARYYAESAARIQAAEEAQRALVEKAKQERKEREEFMQRVEANRALVEEARAAGLAPVLNIPTLDVIHKENRAQQQAELKEKQQEMRTSPYAFDAYAMKMPPRVRAAQKAAYFAEFNAEQGYPDPE